MGMRLMETQRIPTNGARAVEPFTVGGKRLLAIPQLARDVPNAPADMTAGNSDTDVLLLSRCSNRYEPWCTLPAPGGEDAEFFSIGTQSFLAVASNRSGAGPYNFSTASKIFRWHAGRFQPFQTVESFAAKKWKHWSIDGRHFLGLAQGALERRLEGHSQPSTVFEWDGERFTPFQSIASRWGCNWHPFSIDGVTYVAHADQMQSSMLHRWDGEALREVQELAPLAGCSFQAFTRDDEHYLVVACLQMPSRLMRWNGCIFEEMLEFDGLGAREVQLFERDGRMFLVRVNFVLGLRTAPQTTLASQIYEWCSDRFKTVAEFETSGGTDAAVVDDGDRLQLVVSNSLSASARFAGETVVYSVELD